MLANLGFGAIIITAFLLLYCVGAAIYGFRKNAPTWVDSAKNAMLLTFPLLTVSALCIIALLVGNHYEVQYVASVSSRAMPTYLKATALWGGQAGSLFFWSWLMSAFTSSVALRNWERDKEFLPWVLVVSALTTVFFLGLLIFFENPFERLWTTVTGEVIPAMFQPGGASLYIPADGNGLNPLLRHPGMIIHPPMLYLGFVSFVIPFAFGIAALITGRTDDRWIRITRRWTLVAWLFLSLGLILGGRWAYDVLGWGGYWGWDPVEIAAFMPWLSGTAFLHSVMIQEKRNILKHWNMVLIILTYALVIFGTFLTRSGVLSSVHAFAQSAIGPAFFVFIGLTFIVSLSLILQRWNDLKADVQVISLFSREALFMLNNLLFLGILVICLWGVIFPLISELVTGQKVTVGPPFYERATSPLFVALLFLMGVAPLSAWRYSTAKTLGQAMWKPFIASLVVLALVWMGGIRILGALLGFWVLAFVVFVTVYEFWRGALARHQKWNESLPVALWRLAGRNRRRYGGYIIHLGVVFMALGVIGIEIFQAETQGTIPQGGEMTLRGYTITYDSLAVFDAPDSRNVARAVVSVYKDGKFLGQLYPRRDFYYDQSQPMTIPGVRSTWEDDLYVLLVDWLPVTAQGATFKVFHNPLVNWLWFGGFIFIFGTLVAAWPDKDIEPILFSEPQRRYVKSRAKA
ncbi:MAG: heme lyase CcmF/NrfE family subunit [Anaerolineales bacterium]|nr:heme lyase CcmF/NrfE family subunit [Anaerolineales bacterium]